MTITRALRTRPAAIATVVVLAVAGAALGVGVPSAHPPRSASSLAHEGGHVMAAPADTQKPGRIALYTGMRTLWAQHMEWTYATVVAFADSSPALSPTIARLLRNQVDIGQAFSTYYGPAAGAMLTELLQTHIRDAVPVLVAAKAGDPDALDQAVAQWYANAQDIADFLAHANPSWPQADMRSMMRTHITQTIAYAADILAGNDASAIEEYDAAEAHMAEMADILSAGILQQFPQRFSHRAAPRPSIRG